MKILSSLQKMLCMQLLVYNNLKLSFVYNVVALTIHCSIGLYVFTGNPYTIGPLAVKHLVITKTFDDSPVHMSGEHSISK